MSRGQHAADDGSFPRSAGGAMLRGLGLIVIAVALGLVLLNATDGSETFTETSTNGATVATTSTTAGDGESTTSTTAAAAHDPSKVAILVANGSGVQGAARRVADTLKGSNYVLKESVNTKTPAEASIVYYAPGYQADAKAVAALLTPQPAVQPMPDPVPVANLGGANALVVVAADLAAG